MVRNDKNNKVYWWVLCLIVEGIWVEDFSVSYRRGRVWNV